MKRNPAIKGDLDIVHGAAQVVRREGPRENMFRKRRAVNLDHGNIDIAAPVRTLPPKGGTVPEERDRKADGNGQVVRIAVKLDFDPVRMMTTRLVGHDMPARHQIKALAPFEEEAAGIGQKVLVAECRDAR